MERLLNLAGRKMGRTAARIAICTAALAAIPVVASAKDRDGRVDRYRHDDDRRIEYRHDDRHDDHDNHTSVEVRIGTNVLRPHVEERHDRVWVEPIYRTEIQRVWVPATYRTVVDRQWIAPVTRTEVERVWVPDRYENTRVHVITPSGAYWRTDKVLCEKGHWEDRPHEVVVVPGHYEDCPRQELVCDGHYEDRPTQVLVTPGHFEDRCDTVAIAPRDSGHASIDLRIPFRW
jgi:hypothetical protein